MAFTQELVAPDLQLYRCYHCGLESTESSFKYFDNKKVDQPRFECYYCHKFFTLGSHGRRQGKTYAKKRNEDPVELKGLSRQCRHCGVADNALFKYYNNNNLLQPRFKCLSCENQFQMRLLGIGEERRSVHTSSSSQQRRAPRRPKQGVPEPFPNASSSSEYGSYQACDESFMPVLLDPLIALEPGTRLLPELSHDEDEQYSDFLEAELTEEENNETDALSWTGNGDDGNLPPPLSNEVAEYLDFLESELFTEEENYESDPVSWTGNADDGNLPPPLSDEVVQYLDFLESELFTDENMEAPNADAFSSTAANVDDALPPASENSTLSVARVQPTGPESSSSSSTAVSTLLFAHPFRVIPEPVLFQQALTEDEQGSDFHWNEGEEAEDDVEMAPWAY